MSTAIRAGLAAAVLCSTLPVGAATKPATAAPSKPAPVATKKTTKATAKPAAKPAAKPKTPAKPAPKPAPVVRTGKTPGETVSQLIAAMRKEDTKAISRAFDWNRFAKEMNSMLEGQKGLTASTYETLLVETFNVGPEVSKEVRVGKTTMKGTDKATVEMERLLPVGTEKNGPKAYRPINMLSLYKSPTGWKIYRLDSSKEPVTPVVKPMAPQSPQGMVPAAGTEEPPKPK